MTVITRAGAGLHLASFLVMLPVSIGADGQGLAGLELTYDDLLSLPHVEKRIRLSCVSGWTQHVVWRGPRVRESTHVRWRACRCLEWSSRRRAWPATRR